MSKIPIPTKVLEQLEAIRQSGKTNMCDRKSVQYYAYEENFYDLVCWLEEFPKEYAKGIFAGFEADENYGILDDSLYRYLIKSSFGGELDRRSVGWRI